jgi:hypothetical protein
MGAAIAPELCRELHRARRQVAYIRDKFIQVTHRESADLIELLADRLEPRTPSIHRASND